MLSEYSSHGSDPTEHQRFESSNAIGANLTSCEIRDVRVEDWVLIDESGINLGLIRLFAWALKGRRAYGEQPQRGRTCLWWRG